MTAPADSSRRTAARDAATVTTWNFASRITGFVRVLVVGGALGATRLGDTYQGANQVSNVLFEFLAAGTLSAVLVPGLVARITSDDRDAARDFAGALLGRALMALAPIVVLGVVFARPIMRVLVDGNDGSSRSAQVRLGAFLLAFVLPQLLLYAWGAVVTAMLHADGRFAAAAMAPVANNVVVSSALGLFWIRGATGLDLGLSDRVLLGGGALGGVLCMSVLPAVAAWRAGLAVVPRWRGAKLASSARRDIAWASLAVIPTQVVVLASLVVAGRVAGGVIACQIAFTLFLLPHALLGHPLATVLYPRMAAAWARNDGAGARREARRALATSLMLTAPAAALLVALAPWVVRVVSIGALARGAGPTVVAAALSGYAVGLCAYSWTLLATRIAYASGDARTPGLAAVAGGVVALVVLVGFARGADTSTLRWIGLAHSAMAVVAVLGLLVVLVRRRVVEMDLRRWLVPLGSAAAAGVAARVVAETLSSEASRTEAMVVGGLAALAGVGLYAFALWLFGVRAPVEGELAA